MADTKCVEITMKLEQQLHLVTPITEPVHFFQNIDNTVFRSLYVDLDNDDDESNDCCSVSSESTTTPLDFRRDWSKDWKDENAEREKEGPASSELYTLLQETISTIDPYDDDYEDDTSCTSLPTNIPSDIFNNPINLNNECKKSSIRDEVSHDRINDGIDREYVKRTKLN